MEDRERYCIIYGQRVKECRNRLNLSLKGLAEKVDMTKQGIDRIEKGEPGKTQIRKENLKPLATALECTELYLTGKTDEMRGTGIKVDINGEQKELIKGLIKYDYEKDLTSRVRQFGPVNAELMSLFVDILMKMKPEEQQWLKEFLKALPVYTRYKNAKKTSMAEYIIAEMHENCFTKKMYENIYRTIPEDEVIRMKKRRLNKEDFVKQMRMEYGDEVLDFIHKEMERILDAAFKASYSPNRVRKGFSARMQK